MNQTQLFLSGNRPGGSARLLSHVIAVVSVASVVIASSGSAYAQAPGLAAPHLILKESVARMPKTDLQEVRVLTAAFKPGDRTVFHSHRSPVTVYVLEGQFTLDLEGRAPVVVSAGQAFVEPPNVKMTGYNKSTTDALRVVIFYVSDIGTPFLDPVQ